MTLGFKKLVKVPAKKLLQGGQLRYSRSVGLGFKTPVEAIKVRLAGAASSAVQCTRGYAWLLNNARSTAFMPAPSIPIDFLSPPYL